MLRSASITYMSFTPADDAELATKITQLANRTRIVVAIRRSNFRATCTRMGRLTEEKTGPLGGPKEEENGLGHFDYFFASAIS